MANMNEVFRSFAIHQAHFHKTLITSWGTEPGAERVEPLMEGLVYDGLWLTKFPLLHTPQYGILRLDALNKAWQVGAFDPTEALSLRSLVDADLLRFVLSLKPADCETRVELFWGGRAMNKALWNYLAAWFEHSACLRARLGSRPGMFDTVFS